MPLWEFIGWVGSVLVVVSLMVPSVRCFRILNLTGSLIATVYNAYFAIWPYAAMNGAIVIIDIYWLWRLSRRSAEDRGYSIVDVTADGQMVTHFLDRHEAAIAKSFPRFGRADLADAQAFFIMHDDEIIGLFGVRAEEGTGHVLIDFVAERFRDFTPGAFLYSNEAMFAELGVTTLRLPMRNAADPVYFAKQGFVDQGDTLVRAI